MRLLASLVGPLAPEGLCKVHKGLLLSVVDRLKAVEREAIDCLPCCSRVSLTLLPFEVEHSEGGYTVTGLKVGLGDAP